MKYKPCLLALLCWLFAVSGTLTAQAQTDADKIDELVTAYARQYKFNGTVLVVSKGQVVFSKGYGFKNAQDTTYNNVNTIYQLGSVTKQFTATIILQLQEQKKLSVKDKLSKYFPDFPQGDRITIENLLTHTAGIYNYTNDKSFMSSLAFKPITQEKMLALFKDKPLDFEPGTEWSYSNSGYILLGYIIEKITGKPYETVIRERIFKPLNMTHSGFDFAHLNNPDKATGYNSYTEKLKLKAGIADSSVSFSAGAIYSTVNDLWQWHKAILKNTIIGKASQEKAFTPFKHHYGYGWNIDTLYGRREVHHGGGIFGFNTNLASVPADNICIVLLCNMNTGALDAINNGILAILLKEPYQVPQERTEIKVDSLLLQQYVGEYELSPTFKIAIRLADGRLKAKATNQPEIDIFAESTTKFFYKAVDAQIEFIKDATGKIEKLILYQNGAEIPAPKIK